MELLLFESREMLGGGQGGQRAGQVILAAISSGCSAAEGTASARCVKWCVACLACCKTQTDAGHCSSGGKYDNEWRVGCYQQRDASFSPQI